VLTQPANSKAGKPFSVFPTIAVTDASGAVDTSDNSTWVQVTITTGTGSAGAFLGGNVTSQVLAGVVQFDDLEIDMPGQDYTLTFSDFVGPLASAESDPFDITSGGGGGDEEEEKACSTNTGESWLAAILLTALAAAAFARKKKQPEEQS
jgi:hypothetical protein